MSAGIPVIDTPTITPASELKPCPWCKKLPVMHHPSIPSNVDLFTHENCTRFDFFTAEEWNTRPSEEADRARIAELEAEQADDASLIVRQNSTIARLEQEIERLRGIIAAVSCNEATITDCERYCSHGEDKLHAEGRAIRAATTYAEPEPGR